METRNTPVLREIIEVLSSEVDHHAFWVGLVGLFTYSNEEKKRKEKGYTHLWR